MTKRSVGWELGSGFTGSRRMGFAQGVESKEWEKKRVSWSEKKNVYLKSCQPSVVLGST